MAIEVRIPTILRTHTGGNKTVQGNGDTLGALVDDIDVLLAHLAVDDPEAAELDLVTGQAGAGTVLAGGDQHVVRLGLGGVADVGARGVGLGGGVRVVDDHGHLVPVVHVAVQLQQVGAVELVERRRAGRVEHRDEALGPVTALGAGDDATGLVRVVFPGVGHDGVVDRAVDAQHRASLGSATGRRPPRPGRAPERVTAAGTDCVADVSDR